MTKKLSACIVSYHHSERGIGRSRFVKDCLQTIPVFQNVNVVAGDFEHIEKCKINESVIGVHRIHVLAYRSNLSVARVLSYIGFAKKVRKHIAVTAADFLYVCVPDYFSALSVLWFLPARKRRVVIDVVDLWPDALPLPEGLSRLWKRWLGPIIKGVRYHLFKHADLILFQSTYFRSLYGVRNQRCDVLPMCSDRPVNTSLRKRRANLKTQIRFVFLGSMNSITDIESLGQLLILLSHERKICLSVIGGGAGLPLLNDLLAGSDVEVTHFGLTFDETVKCRELQQSDFGYNGYKKATEVAVSYKSLEYLQFGVPLINSAKGDTQEFVMRERCGFNFDSDNVGALVRQILDLSDDEHSLMVASSFNVFGRFFSVDSFHSKLTSSIRCLL